MKVERTQDGLYEYRAVDDDGEVVARANDKTGLVYALYARGGGR